MDERKKDEGQGETIPHAKRSGRESVEPGGLPGEFVDDLRTNRDEPSGAADENEPGRRSR